MKIILKSETAWSKDCTRPAAGKEIIQKYVKDIRNLFPTAIAADFVYYDYISYNRSHSVSSLR